MLKKGEGALRAQITVIVIIENCLIKNKKHIKTASSPGDPTTF
jgi:hypothetical protein